MTATQRPDEDRLDRLERIVAEAVAGLAEVRDIQAGAAAAQAEAAAAQAEAAVAHKAEMAEIRSIVANMGKRIDQLTEQQERNNHDLSVIKGWQTELAVERTAFDVFNRLSSFGTLMRIFPKDELLHYTINGARRNYITDEEANKATAIDFLMEGVDGTGAPVMFAIEVSYAAGYDDVGRAIERAPLIKKAIGREVVIPAVVAEVISQDFEDYARINKIRWTYVANGNRISQ